MARLVIILFGLMFCVSWAGAADLRDPTQPPFGYVTDAAGVAPPPPPPLKVTSIMVRPGKRSVAMVDGMPVRVGDSLGEGKVTRIDEGGLWLRTDAGPRRISLLPSVEKTAPVVKMEKAKR
jgi:hypothetical protein